MKMRTAPTSRRRSSGSTTRACFGRPQLVEGRIADIYAENGFVVVRDGVSGKLENPGIGPSSS